MFIELSAIGGEKGDKTFAISPRPRMRHEGEKKKLKQYHFTIIVVAVA